MALLGVGVAPSPPTWWGKVSALLGASGLSMLSLQFGRGAGKRKEPDLFRLWGGKPTTQLLRHAGTSNPVALERRHEQLGRITGLSLPDAMAESTDRTAADNVYDAAVEVLKERTRDAKAFP